VALGYRVTRGAEALGRARTTVAFAHRSGGLTTMPETYQRALRAWSSGHGIEARPSSSPESPA
jgi:hypothetical protein